MTVVINGTTGIDTGTGSLIAADATTPTYLDLFEDTDNGSNYVRLIAPTSVAANRTLTLPDETGTVITSGGSGVVSQAMLATLVVPIGVGQTWQDVSASRTAGVTYTNSTGKPIMVATRTTATSADFSITVSGVVAALCSNASTTRIFLSTIVPNGATYVVSGYQAGFWSELR